MTTFFPRAHIIDAMQWDGDPETAYDLGAWQMSFGTEIKMYFFFEGDRLHIRNREHVLIMTLGPGDWVVYSRGHFSALAAVAFPEMYEEI